MNTDTKPKVTATPTDWTDQRCEDLGMLEELLNTASSLGTSSPFIRNVERVIELAGKLNRSNREERRASFAQFLDNLALRDRFPNSNIDKVK